jgi:hypothetical protein
MSMNQQQTPEQRVQTYQQIVQIYEELDHEIDSLIMKYDGASKNMPDAVLMKYREMARRRSELRNEMRILEQDLFSDD